MERAREAYRVVESEVRIHARKIRKLKGVLEGHCRLPRKRMRGLCTFATRRDGCIVVVDGRDTVLVDPSADSGHLCHRVPGAPGRMSMTDDVST